MAAPPSAELEPIREGEAAQTDEQDMGMTYDVRVPDICGVLHVCLSVGLHGQGLRVCRSLFVE